MRGVIRPNQPYIQHFHAGIHFTQAQPREFVVDARARQVIDEPGRPLVLTPAAYDEIKKKFGTQLVCEPVGGVESAVDRISVLEEDLDEAKKEIDRRGMRIRELEMRQGELEQQLAKKSKSPPASPAAPAAPAAPVP